MLAPLIIGRRDGQYEHITMALLDSGNLLQQPAINARLHQTLGVGVDKTNVVARGANQLFINIKGNFGRNIPQIPQPPNQLLSETLGGRKSGITTQPGE